MNEPTPATVSEVLTAAAKLVDDTSRSSAGQPPLAPQTAINTVTTGDPHDCGLHRSSSHADLALGTLRAVYAALGYLSIPVTVHEWAACPSRSSKDVIDLLLVAAEFADRQHISTLRTSKVPNGS